MAYIPTRQSTGKSRKKDLLNSIKKSYNHPNFSKGLSAERLQLRKDFFETMDMAMECHTSDPQRSQELWSTVDKMREFIINYDGSENIGIKDGKVCRM